MKDVIVQTGDPVLRKKAKPILKKEFGTPALKKLIAKMKSALDKEPYGVALAAPQVGANVRLFIIAPKAFLKDDEDEFESPVPTNTVYINPELIRVSRKKLELSEGCLSVRGTYGTVLRHEKATVKAFDENGKPFIHHGNGLIAHIFQHEVDHLEGVLYTDKAKRLTTDESRSS